MNFLRKRKKEKIDKIKERDSGELSQAMIIISGLAVAGVVVTGAIAGVSLTKGEESARCISEFSTFSSGAVDDNCSITASDNSGTLLPGENENATPGEPIEKNSTSEDCFEVSPAYGGTTSITKYLIAEKPEECGKFVIIPDEIDGAPVVDIGRDSFNPLNREEHGIISVTIPSTVKTIGRGAFANNVLTSVTIPGSVTEIDMTAFKNNELSSVNIPDSVEHIGTGAFMSNQLTSVNIPDSVTSIGMEAFRNNQLTSVTVPESVASIADSTFRDNKLTSVTMPDSITTIGSSAFYNNQLTSVTVPDSVTTMNNAAFANNNLTDVNMPNSLTSIESSVFANNNLASVAIPESVETIKGSAFSNNQLTSVTVPESVKSIHYSALHHNYSLKEIRLPTGIKFTGNPPMSRHATIIYY